jgi:hypothetical protein
MHYAAERSKAVLLFFPQLYVLIIVTYNYSDTFVSLLFVVV